MLLQFLKKLFGLPLTLYGVWRPGIGWLQHENQTYAGVDWHNVKQVAQRCGGQARVEIVDEVLQYVDHIFLEQEKRK